VPGVCADGVAGWPLWLPVLRVSFSPGAMFAGERLPAAREECVVCSEGKTRRESGGGDLSIDEG
jgi:hypothetical protein